MTKPHAKILLVGVLTVIAEVGALYCAAYFKGDDHPNYLPFAIAFPIPFLFSIPFLHVLALAAITMLAQFPIYGYVLGQAWIRGHLRRTALRLSVFHSAFAVASVCSLLIKRA